MKTFLTGVAFGFLILALSTVAVASTERTLELTIDSTTILVNGSEVVLDVAPFIKDGRTFVPLRFIAEQMNGDISWTSKPDGTTDKVIIKLMVESQAPPPSATPTPSEGVVGSITKNGAKLTVVQFSKHSKIGIWVPENEGDIFLNVEVILENISREEVQGNSLQFEGQGWK